MPRGPGRPCKCVKRRKKNNWAGVYKRGGGPNSRERGKEITKKLRKSPLGKTQTVSLEGKGGRGSKSTLGAVGGQTTGASTKGSWKIIGKNWGDISGKKPDNQRLGAPSRGKKVI